MSAFASSRATVAQFYWDLTSDFSLHAHIPHTALHFLDLCAAEFESSDIRPLSAACFLMAQKAVDTRVMKAEDLETCFVTTRDEILGLESTLFQWFTADLGRMRAWTEQPDRAMHDTVARVGLPLFEADDAWKFFNLASIHLFDETLETRTSAACHAALKWNGKQQPPLSADVAACRDRILSYASHQYGTRFALASSSSALGRSVGAKTALHDDSDRR